jgi:hypothetical protein
MEHAALFLTCVQRRAHSSTVEQVAHNHLVLGSNPGGPTMCVMTGDDSFSVGKLRAMRLLPNPDSPAVQPVCFVPCSHCTNQRSNSSLRNRDLSYLERE